MKAYLESIEIIIFDLGGVLIDLDYSATSFEMKKLGFLNFDKYYSQSDQQAFFDDFDTGKISEQAFINQLKSFVGTQVTPNQLVHAWNKMIGVFPLQKVKLLEVLQGKRLAMLSNTNSLHWKKVEIEWGKVSNIPINNYFEKIFLSHEIGMRKPHADTFLAVCDLLKVNPSKTLFIDDSPQHILGATQAGLNTFYYKNQTEFLQFFS
ncbi:MAG: HAD family phosphatase [Bacteroidetes bacterium]|nr:HAD family phosphatase [Bacteroidota bacterium]